MSWPERDDLPVLRSRSYITVTTGAHGQIGFPDLWPLPRAVHFHGYWWGRGVGGWRDDFWGWHWCLTGLRGAVKTKPLINAIDQQKNRGKCDLHTARVINALTDFFSHPPPSLKSDFLSFQSERERVQTNVDRLGLSQTRIQSILLDGEGWSIAGETT